MNRTIVAITLVLVALPLLAGEARAEVGFQGWGPRIGISDDPDQVVVGAHFDLGEFAQHVRFQPSVDFGFGDDITTFTGNAMVGYYFPVKGQVTPYAGGQVTAAVFHHDEWNGEDHHNDEWAGEDDTNTEIGGAIVGGIEARLKGGTRFLVELQIGLGDVPDVKLLAGWTF
jgi:opacity protein-like surface antigen